MDNIFDLTTCSQEVPEFNMEIFERAKAEIKKIESKLVLVGIVVNKRTYNWLKKNSTEIKYNLTQLNLWSLIPWDHVAIHIKKNQRGYRSFYNKENLEEYLRN